MLCLAKQKDRKRILEFLEEDFGNCIYLYMDIKKYSFDDGYIRVWINQGKELNTVVMRYFDSLQIYGHEKFADIEGILNCILSEDVQMISGQKILIDRLKILDGIERKYESRDGYVFLFDNYREFSCEEIERAEIEDCEEIAHLMCMDKGFAGNYCIEELSRQLKERMKTGMGRSYIIRKEQKIIAHIATFAENVGIAVTSGLIVHPAFRDYPYGTVMESYLVNKLKKEKFQVYTFVNEKKRAKMLRAMGHVECGQYEKLIKNRL